MTFEVSGLCHQIEAPQETATIDSDSMIRRCEIRIEEHNGIVEPAFPKESLGVNGEPPPLGTEIENIVACIPQVACRLR